MRSIVFAIATLVAVSAQAQSLEFVKRVAVPPQTGSKIKDVAVDASGNLYVTQFMGTDLEFEIKKVTDPLGAATVTDFTTGVKFLSSNGSNMAFDGAGNMYFTNNKASDGSLRKIYKFTTAGALDTSFGAGGVLDYPNGQPRQISYSAEGGGRLIVTNFATPYSVSVLNAATGATIATSALTLGDTADTSVLPITVQETWSGHYYDEAAKVIYANANCDLVKMSVTSLDNIAAGAQTVMTFHGRHSDSANGMSMNKDLGIIAYSTMIASNVVSAWATNSLHFYDIASGKDTPFYFPATGDGKLDFESATADMAKLGGLTWFKSGADHYLAVGNFNANAVNIYKFNAAPVKEYFNFVKAVPVERFAAGAGPKTLATATNGDILIGSYYAGSTILKVSNILGTPVTSNFNATEFPSSSGNCVATDAAGNVYYGVQDAAHGVYKFDSAGNPVTAFGTNGKSFQTFKHPTTGATINASPRAIKVVGNRILISTFSTPYSIVVMDATTGLLIGTDKGVVFPNYNPFTGVFTAGSTAGASAQSVWYDEKNKYFYGNLQGALLRFKFDSMDDIVAANTLDTKAELIGLNLVGQTDMPTISADPTGTWVSWVAGYDKARATAFAGAAGTNLPAIMANYNTGTGEIAYINSLANTVSNISQGGGSTWLVKDGKSYLIAISYYQGLAGETGSFLRVFEYTGPTADVADWSVF